MKTLKTLTLAQARAAGYCITSRYHRLANRLDRKDWREHMAQQHAPWDPEGTGMSWVTCMGDSNAADHYRRCYSEDKIVVPEEWVKPLGNSGSGPTEFRYKPYEQNSIELQKEILLDYLKFG